MLRQKPELNIIYISERMRHSLQPVARSSLTAVVAPMGYGKTTAINWYLNERGREGAAVLRVSIYSAAVNICSAPTGILIPPSGPLILYSITAGGVSVAALFMGGYLPGILMGLCVAGLAIFIAVKKGYKSSDVKDPDPAIKVIIDAVPSLLAVIIVMGGRTGCDRFKGDGSFSPEAKWRADSGRLLQNGRAKV